MRKDIEFREAVQKFRDGDPDITKWWIEKIDMVASSVIKPFLLLGFEEEDLRQDVFVLLYEKLKSVSDIGGMGYMKEFVLSQLIGRIAKSYDVDKAKLMEEVRYNKHDVAVKQVLSLNNVMNINSLSNNLFYEDPFPQSVIKDHIDTLLKTVRPREDRVLRLRYGIDDDVQTKLRDVANILGRTTERIRQIEHDGMRKFRYYARGKEVYSYIKYDETPLPKYSLPY